MDTRAKNTYGNYCLEQRALSQHRDWILYPNGASGQPHCVQLAGNGMIQGRMAARDLAYNYTDIESFLRGTGLNNLNTPAQDLRVEPKQIQMANVYERNGILMPEPLIVAKGQRPQFS